MKRILLITLLLMLAGMMLANSVAILSASKGNVDLERARKSMKFKNGELLLNRDVLRTGPESFAAYKYIDASSMIKLFSNSVVTVNATQDGEKLSKRVNVSKGSVLTNVKSGTGAFTVQTPTTVASVKGTEFLTKVDDDGFSTFIVTEGEVELRVLLTDEVTSAPKGTTAVIDPDGEVEVRESTYDDISEIEKAELESSQEKKVNTIRIPVLDSEGKLKYIEITY
jgi:hypothetical protein